MLLRTAFGVGQEGIRTVCTMCRRSAANAERHTWRRLDRVAIARGKNRAVAAVVLPATSSMVTSFMGDSFMSPCVKN